MDWGALEDFQLVATHKGFGRASRISGRSKATLSRRVRDLEIELGVELIQRRSFGLELTEEGQLLLSRTEGPFREVAEAIAATKDGREVPRGHLRIAAPLTFSQLVLGKITAKFRKEYPSIQVEVLTQDRPVNMAEEGFDVAIWTNPAQNESVIGTCFAYDRQIFVASPNLQIPKGLGKQPIPVPTVVVAKQQIETLWWIESRNLTIEPEPVLSLPSFLMVRDAVAEGVGIAQLPISVVGKMLERGELISLGNAGERVELWVFQSSHRYQSPKIRAFIDFLCKQFPEKLFMVQD
jgi:DNA-binding transcriptional LysR family regulator